MRGALGKSGAGFAPFNQFEEMTRQNVQFFEKAFSMFSPFNMFGEEKAEEAQPAARQRRRQ